MENDDARSGNVPDVAIFDGTRDIRGTESLARSAVVWGAEGVGYVARCSGITGGVARLSVARDIEYVGGVARRRDKAGDDTELVTAGERAGQDDVGDLL